MKSTSCYKYCPEVEGQSKSGSTAVATVRTLLISSTVCVPECEEWEGANTASAMTGFELSGDTSLHIVYAYGGMLAIVVPTDLYYLTGRMHCSQLQACSLAYGEDLPIPEIVVVGGQSDGKSSLIEAFLGKQCRHVFQTLVHYLQHPSNYVGTLSPEIYPAEVHVNLNACALFCPKRVSQVFDSTSKQWKWELAVRSSCRCITRQMRCYPGAFFRYTRLLHAYACVPSSGAVAYCRLLHCRSVGPRHN